MPGYAIASGRYDQRDIVWPKLQLLREKYLEDMVQLYALICGHDTEKLSAENAQKLKFYKEVCRRMLPYLQVTKERLPLEFRQDLLDRFEQQLSMIIETFKRKPCNEGTTR